MSDWYYADAARQRQGPLSAAELAQRFHQGAIRLDTLVWRDGLPQWQPLRDFTEELALHQAPTETFYSPTASTSTSNYATPDDIAAAAVASPYAPPSATLTPDETFRADGDVVYAGFWKRFAAASIDNLILTVFLLIVLGVGAAMFGGFGALKQGFTPGQPPSALFGGFFIFGFYVVPIVSQAIYFTWMQASAGQASLGKMAVGIKVTRGDGTRMTLARSLGRWAGLFFFYLFSCGLAYLVSAIMAGVTLRKQGLHDMAADTLVVDKWAYTAHPEWQRRELGAVTIAVMILMGLLVVGYVVMIFFMIGMGAMGARS